MNICPKFSRRVRVLQDAPLRVSAPHHHRAETAPPRRVDPVGSPPRVHPPPPPPSAASAASSRRPPPPARQTSSRSRGTRTCPGSRTSRWCPRRRPRTGRRSEPPPRRRARRVGFFPDAEGTARRERTPGVENGMFFFFFAVAFLSIVERLRARSRRRLDSRVGLLRLHYAVAPEQLDPAPAVHPKQWLSTASRRFPVSSRPAIRRRTPSNPCLRVLRRRPRSPKLRAASACPAAG